MIRLKSSLRRALTVTAGAVLGVSGVVAVAVPASAHATNIDATYKCDTAKGDWVVDWTLRNDFRTDATVTELKTSPVAVQDLVTGLIIPHRAGNQDGTATGVQIVPGSATSATVSFTALWPVDDAVDIDNTKTVSFDGGCAPAKAPCVDADHAKFHHTFAVDGEKSMATVTLDDGIDLCEGEPVTLVSYLAPRPRFSTPQYAFDHDTAVIDNVHRAANLQVDVPECNTQVDLFFGGEKDIISEIVDHGRRYGDTKLGSGHGLGGRSEGRPGAFNGGRQACQQPAVKALPQCDGSLTLNLSNDGKLSRYAVTFTVRTGDSSKEITVRPGKGTSVTIPAGTEVVVHADGMPDVRATWQQPQDCDLPSVVVKSDCDTVAIAVQNPQGVAPVTAKVTYGSSTKSITVAAGKTEKVTFPAGKATSATVAFPGLDVEPVKATVEKQDCGGAAGGGAQGGGNGGGGLPVTGPAAAGIAAAAAGLLAIGAVLFLTARRRRIRFTA